jgi:hypothetical protein
MIDFNFFPRSHRFAKASVSAELVTVPLVHVGKSRVIPYVAMPEEIEEPIAKSDPG